MAIVTAVVAPLIRRSTLSRISTVIAEVIVLSANAAAG